MRAFSCLLGAVWLLVIAPGAAAQWPGEARGRVVDALTGLPVAAAEISAEGDAARVLTDARGGFLLRGLEPGPRDLRASAPGYEPETLRVGIENGRVTEVMVRLVPRPMEVEGVVASVRRSEAGTFALGSREIRALPAATAGDVAATVPGVRIEERGRGSAQIPSIRGSSGDAVLVLVDGVPINDPITGEADLSTLAASSVASLRVLPGGRSARYGARAEGGVILIETARAEEAVRMGGAHLAGRVGSLGEHGLEGRMERGLLSGLVGVGGSFSRTDGSFDFELPESTGSRPAHRDNTHVRAAAASLWWSGGTDGGSDALQGVTSGRYRLTVGAERLLRGLPGRSYAPSRLAEQELRRIRASSTLDRSLGVLGTLGANAHWTLQRVDHVDPDPPFGDPYDDRTTLQSAGAEARLGRDLGRVSLGTGLAARHVTVESTQLAGDSSATRFDTGGWLTASVEGPSGLGLSATGRIDRSGLPSRWYASHDLGLSWRRGALLARLGHRSSFSPPTLGDQFFREGVGVRPNPELEAERVPSEWVAGLAVDLPRAGVLLGLEAEAYVGDVRGMIVWVPDFRFVWSPQNRDVRRRGVEAGVQLGVPAHALDLRAHASWNRVTWPRGADEVQVPYRPEHSAGLTLGWSPGLWSASVAAAYTGARNPVPNPVNRLPGFWTVDAALSRRTRTPWGPVELRLDVKRLFDEKEGLIFAFPDPGRTLHLTLRLG